MDHRPEQGFMNDTSQPSSPLRDDYSPLRFDDDDDGRPSSPASRFLSCNNDLVVDQDMDEIIRILSEPECSDGPIGTRVDDDVSVLLNSPGGNLDYSSSSSSSSNNNVPTDSPSIPSNNVVVDMEREQNAVHRHQPSFDAGFAAGYAAAMRSTSQSSCQDMTSFTEFGPTGGSPNRPVVDDNANMYGPSSSWGGTPNVTADEYQARTGMMVNDTDSMIGTMICRTGLVSLESSSVTATVGSLDNESCTTISHHPSVRSDYRGQRQGDEGLSAVRTEHWQSPPAWSSSPPMNTTDTTCMDGRYCDGHNGPRLSASSCFAHPSKAIDAGDRAMDLSKRPSPDHHGIGRTISEDRIKKKWRIASFTTLTAAEEGQELSTQCKANDKKCGPSSRHHHHHSKATIPGRNTSLNVVTTPMKAKTAPAMVPVTVATVASSVATGLFQVTKTVTKSILKSTIPRRDKKRRQGRKGSTSSSSRSSSSSSSSSNAVQQVNVPKRQRKRDPDRKTPTTLTPVDVIVEQGGASNHHPGNKAYLDHVRTMKDRYQAGTTSRTEKYQMSKDVVQWVHDRGGRFLKRDKVPNSSERTDWYEVRWETARLKASQALRE